MDKKDEIPFFLADKSEFPPRNSSASSREKTNQNLPIVRCWLLKFNTVVVTNRIYKANMPESVIIPGSATISQSVAKPSATFSGEVFMEVLHRDTTTVLANVTFTPCARTHWHTHEHGQMIRVLSGTGWICDKGQEARRIKAGDTVWAPAGTTHWHGADDGSIMTHFVIGLGETKWHEAVTDEEYKTRSFAWGSLILHMYIQNHKQDLIYLKCNYALEMSSYHECS